MLRYRANSTPLRYPLGYVARFYAIDNCRGRPAGFAFHFSSFRSLPFSSGLDFRRDPIGDPLSMTRSPLPQFVLANPSPVQGSYCPGPKKVQRRANFDMPRFARFLHKHTSDSGPPSIFSSEDIAKVNSCLRPVSWISNLSDRLR